MARFKQGKVATLLLFGQTGTGKTHTLREALAYVSANCDWAELLDLTFVELQGGRVV